MSSRTCCVAFQHVRRPVQWERERGGREKAVGSDENWGNDGENGMSVRFRLGRCQEGRATYPVWRSLPAPQAAPCDIF
jgi:hypothetical protein